MRINRQRHRKRFPPRRVMPCIVVVNVREIKSSLSRHIAGDFSSHCHWPSTIVNRMHTHTHTTPIRWSGRRAAKPNGLMLNENEMNQEYTCRVIKGSFQGFPSDACTALHTATVPCVFLQSVVWMKNYIVAATDRLPLLHRSPIIVIAVVNFKCRLRMRALHETKQNNKQQISMERKETNFMCANGKKKQIVLHSFLWVFFFRFTNRWLLPSLSFAFTVYITHIHTDTQSRYALASRE